jgi:hypothetical protein
MSNIEVGRYDDPESVGWQGWVQPEDRSWILYVKTDGSVTAFLNRDPDGAVK